MTNMKNISMTFALTLVCTLFTLAQAQTPRMATVNISTQPDKIHIAAEGEVSEIRVEVADESGDVVFQSGAISGGTLDWKMTDAQGERVAAGTYLVTVTFRGAAGKLRKRVEQVTIAENEKANTRAANALAPNAAQATITGAGTAGRIAKFTGAATIGNSIMVESGGKIGIYNAAPTSTLHVVISDPNNPVITGRNLATVGTGVSGQAPDGFGVTGFSTSGTGVYGNTGSGNGVRGGSSSGRGVYGVSNSGTGLHGLSNSSYGTWGQSNSGIGVYGISSAGVGVYGTSSRNDGIVGVSYDDNRAGVSGSHPGGGYGIYGENLSSGFAGYFVGKVHVAGTLSKASGSFKIDHPLDPKNKTLSHSFVESPDMMNIYNGNITTDAKGNATITLPNYFQALNRDFRYQLTVIGGEFAQAIISSKIEGNRFTIKTDKPNVEVSWMVTGIRQDAYAEAHRIPVEEEKPEKERGTYLNPEVFNQPKEKGIEQARQAEQTQGTTAEAAQLQTTRQK